MTEQKKPKREKQKAELRKQARLDGLVVAEQYNCGGCHVPCGDGEICNYGTCA